MKHRFLLLLVLPLICFLSSCLDDDSKLSMSSSMTGEATQITTISIAPSPAPSSQASASSVAATEGAATTSADNCLVIDLYRKRVTIPLGDEDIAHMKTLLAKVGERVDISEQNYDRNGGQNESLYFPIGISLKWNDFENEYGATGSSSAGYDVYINTKGDKTLYNWGKKGYVWTELCEYLIQIAQERSPWEYTPIKAIAQIDQATFVAADGSKKVLTSQEVNQVKEFIGNASTIGHIPATEDVIGVLHVRNDKNEEVLIYLDAHTDLFRLGSCVYYDYGPKLDEDARAQMFAILNLPKPK